jgi:hypothetical protein
VVREVYRGLTSEFGEVDTYVDLHHQGACCVMPDDPDEVVTLSISGKFVDDPAGTPGYEKYADDYDGIPPADRTSAGRRRAAGRRAHPGAGELSSTNRRQGRRRW